MQGHRRVVAVVLLVASLRAVLACWSSPGPDLLAPADGLPLSLPDPELDGWVPLTWLPGIGPARARKIVAERNRLGVPLRPDRLHLLPGIGATMQEAVDAWYARSGWERPEPDGFRSPGRGG